MNVVGHAAALAQIPDPLPHALLLSGPDGVGKRRIATELAAASGVGFLDFQNLGPLDRDGSRALIEHHEMAPLDGPIKVTIADLTRASHEAVNSILKVLEEPPAYSRFILHSDVEPLLTIRSRCFNVRFGGLAKDEVATVLNTLGVTDCMEAARHSQGRVSAGLDYARNTGARRAAEAVLLAVARRDMAAVQYALVDALEKGEGSFEDAKRIVLSRLLAQSLRASLTDDTHALAKTVSLPLRRRALEILESPSRPVLRVRAATWCLMAG